MSRIYPIDVNEYPRLNPEQEKDLLSQLKYSDCTEKKQEARDALVYHNMGLIYSVINKVCAKSQNSAEMVSYGVEGFLIALDKYDINSNAKLTTYAYNWVFKKVVEGNRADHIIQFPENVWDGIAKYTRAVETFKKDNEINPTNRPFSDECADGFVSDMERALVVNGDMSLSLTTPHD